MPKKSIVVQLFNWTFSDITQELPTLKNLGYSHALVSPPSLSSAGLKWWKRYQPIDYSIPTQKTTCAPLGTREQFKEMIKTAKKNNIDIVVDLVLNHMANLQLPENRLFFPPFPQHLGEDYDKLAKEIIRLGLKPGSLYQPNNFNPKSSQSVLTEWLGGDLPDLKTGDFFQPHHDEVFKKQKAYIDSLVKMGVKGFRLDAAKHIPAHYFQKLFRELKDDIWLFGEIIATSPSEYLKYMESYLRLGFMDLYDFPLVQTLINCISPHGSLRNLKDASSRQEALPGSSAVTFIYKHDIFGNGDDFYEKLRYSDLAGELLAHAFILGRREGTPYIYTQKGKVPDIQEYRPHLDSFHKHPDLIPMLHFHNAMLGTEEKWLWEEDSTIAFQRGNAGIVVINKSNRKKNDTIKTDLPDGNYRNILDPANPLFHVKDSHINLSVDKRKAMMLMK